MKERSANSAVDIVFWTLIGAVRNTLDHNAVAKVVDELCAEYGGVLVAAVLEGVERRIEEERKTVAAPAHRRPARGCGLPYL